MAVTEFDRLFRIALRNTLECVVRASEDWKGGRFSDEDLIEIVGVDRLMLGTDYPFDMSETDPLGLIGATEGLTDDDRAAISGDNAARVFDLG